MKIRAFIEDNFLIDDAETGAMVPFEFRDVQAKYYEELCIDYIEDNNFVGLREIILKARKEGFTSLVLAIFACLAVLDENPSRWLEISYKADSTKQHFQRFRNYLLSYYAKKLGMNYRDPELAKKVFIADRDNVELILAHNGASFYVGTASARTAERGGTVQGILFSEEAHYPDSEVMKASEVVEGTQSQVAVGKGLIFHETTANGFNHFQKRWEQATRGEISDKPRFFSWRDFYTPEEFAVISHGFSDKRKIKQEYPDSPTEAFLTSGDPFFDQDAIEFYSRNTKDYMPFNSEGILYGEIDRANWRQFRKIEPGEFLIVVGDTAGGGGDDNFAHFISVTRRDIPLVYQDNTTCVNMTNNIYPVLERIADITGIKPVVAYERNNGGNFEMDRLHALNRLNKFEIFMMPVKGRGVDEDTGVFGWTTSGATRAPMLDGCKSTIDGMIMTIYDVVTVEQLASFVKVKTSTAWRAQAEIGTHDDAVMSLAIGFEMMNTAKPIPIVTDPNKDAPSWAQERPDWSKA